MIDCLIHWLAPSKCFNHRCVHLWYHFFLCLFYTFLQFAMRRVVQCPRSLSLLRVYQVLFLHLCQSSLNGLHVGGWVLVNVCVAILSIFGARKVIDRKLSGRGPRNFSFNTKEILAHGNAEESHFTPILA